MDELTLRDRVDGCATVILGYAELVLKEEFGSLYPKQEEMLRELVRAANRLRDLLLKHRPPFVWD